MAGSLLRRTPARYLAEVCKQLINAKCPNNLTRLWSYLVSVLLCPVYVCHPRCLCFLGPIDQSACSTMQGAHGHLNFAFSLLRCSQLLFLGFDLSAKDLLLFDFDQQGLSTLLLHCLHLSEIRRFHGHHSTFSSAIKDFLWPYLQETPWSLPVLHTFHG